MDLPEGHLLQKLQEQIELGENLIKRLQVIENVDGVLKLQRKIRQEMQFFRKVLYL